ncbi:DUF4129 domain-containing protein [Nostocoides sp. F2B08]|uniref:DUF4129 domain-containing protein n=1 Tax=Nostocoides sp. F2B08 TaxID=2653936 RepID=UPI0012631720|nr:DUF4129 domain-containing protein [Tetrasphaera sp. F2B08]KAB7741975.1 DUF4129 domain-containing protein [Tetrasphaera sp. F2B08]
MLADELSRPEYATDESPLRRAVRTVVEWFTDLFDGASGGPISYWWYAVVAVAVLGALALGVWAVIRLEPARRARRTTAGGVFDEAGLGAAEYRRRARVARDAGDGATAVLDGFRAIAAEAVERFVLDDRPGATAREIARSLESSFPVERDTLESAAVTFDAVRYGGRGAGLADADAVLALDERLLALTPSVPPEPTRAPA